MADQVITSKVNDGSEVRGNFQNLFDSIGKNNRERSKIYNEFLKHEVEKERQVFDTMKGELQFARYRNSHKRRNFYTKNQINENVITKRKVDGYVAASSELSFEHNITVLDKMFYEHHPPDQENVWEKVEKLTPEMHERICVQEILYSVLPQPNYGEQHNLTSYEYIKVPASKLQEERVIKNATLLTNNRKKKAKITVVKCTFKKFSLFITHATDDHVFTLFEDMKPNHFRLRGGLYPVHYN